MITESVPVITGRPAGRTMLNVVPDGNGLSKGDNWMSNVRDGHYVPDNRQDNRLFSYDDLFMNWEGELNFIVKGFDAINSEGDTKI